MGISQETWKNRLSERSDLSSSIVHLTRSSNQSSLIENLFSILTTGTIKPSTTSTGFIVGLRPAVCFQDAPLTGIAQNILYEQKDRKAYKAKTGITAKIRYQGAGVAFSKDYAYRKGARPVVYEAKAVAKAYLPPNEHWRIVNFDLSDQESFIDWTHEREWRCPDGFTFELDEAIVVLPNPEAYRRFVTRCNKDYPDMLEKLVGVVQLGAVAF